MSDNAFLDATEFANVMLLLLKNSLVMGRLVTGQFKNEVTDENGLTVNIKRPPQFVAQNGEALSLQPIVVGSVPVKVDTYKNVHIDIGDLEHVQSYTQLMQSAVMKAAASELAHEIDSALHDALLEFSSEVGTPGKAIGTPQEFNKVHTRLMDQSVPNSDLNAVVAFEDGELIRGALIGTDISGINRTALEKTRIPILSEITLHASNNIKSVVAGTRIATGGLMNGAAQNVNYRDVKDSNSQTLLIDTLNATETVKRGDTFTIANVFAVNNRGRTPLTFLKQFTVLKDAVTATGAIVLEIAPAIIVGGTSDGVGSDPTIVNTAFQTVDSIPADGAAITFSTAPGSSTPVRAAFNKQAIALVSAKLRDPMSDTFSSVVDPDTGIAIRYWRGSDIGTGRHIHRWDVIFGVKNVQRQLGVRVNGT